MPNVMPNTVSGPHDEYFAQSPALLRGLPAYGPEDLRQEGAPFDDSDKLHAAILDYIGRQPVTYQARRTEGVDHYRFELPGGSSLDTLAQGDRARIGLIGVPYHWRGMGLGGRLMRAGMAYLADQGIVHVDSRALTPSGLHLRAKVFGSDGSTYYDTYDKSKQISWKEAVRSSEFGEAPSAYLHLGNVALQGWERPVPRQSPRGK